MTPEFIEKLKKAFKSLESKPQLMMEAIEIDRKSTITPIWRAFDQDAFHIDMDGEETQEVVFTHPNEEMPLDLEEVDAFTIVILMWYINEYTSPPMSDMTGKIYTREGMRKRVIKERLEKSIDADYKIKIGTHYYGEHQLFNEKNECFGITIWDIENCQGYINNIDWRTNKLATTKHIFFLCAYMKENASKFKHLEKCSPFLEFTLDPLHDYDFTWKYIGELDQPQREAIVSLFPSGRTHLDINQLAAKVNVIRQLDGQEGVIVRPEVYDKLTQYFDNLLITKLENDNQTLDFSEININLFNYQKEGVKFCTFKKGAIIADEMGLGKTVQAISTAMMKRKYFNFTKTLIVCPSSVKYQWKAEILKFTGEVALVVEGLPSLREGMYLDAKYYFFVASYETVIRDKAFVDKASFDFIILDEAQKIKNYETKANIAITSLKKEHGLVLTGTPIENKLIDLYSIILFLDKYKVTPLWEFSYQHCVFDSYFKNKINGYYNLLELRSKISDLVIRRQKKDVLTDLPNLTEKNIFTRLTKEQASLHNRMGQRVNQLVHKKFKTKFDWDEIMRLLTNMRRVSNSTYLIDKTSHHSSKMVELEFILSERINIVNEPKKIIIFSEWIDSLYLIEELLKKLKVGYVKLTGSIAAKKRGDLIKAFESNEDIKVFLSTEAGGSGLNLQVADTVINFEIPWNPAKKNQRIGRIDRLGQLSKKLHVFNLMCQDSIEMRIASGLVLKQNLFDSVLNDDNKQDEVDFSNAGRSQFIKMLEEMFVLNEDGSFADIVQEVDADDILLLGEAITDTYPDLDEDKAPNQVETTVKSEEFEKLEQVLSKGMEFLSGLFEMSTGQKLGGTDGHTISVDKESGEVTLKFKMKF